MRLFLSSIFALELSYGSKAELIEPANLRIIIPEQLKNTAEKYE